MIDPLADLLRPDRLTSVVDIGANPIGSAPPYQHMLEKRLCRVIGFEPQPEASTRSTRTRAISETYLPYVVGDGTSTTLKIRRASGMTSLLAPMRPSCGISPDFPNGGRCSGRSR